MLGDGGNSLSGDLAFQAGIAEVGYDEFADGGFPNYDVAVTVISDLPGPLDCSVPPHYPDGGVRQSAPFVTLVSAQQPRITAGTHAFATTSDMDHFAADGGVPADGLHYVRVDVVAEDGGALEHVSVGGTVTYDVISPVELSGSFSGDMAVLLPDGGRGPDAGVLSGTFDGLCPTYFGN